MSTPLPRQQLYLSRQSLQCFTNRVCKIMFPSVYDLQTFSHIIIGVYEVGKRYLENLFYLLTEQYFVTNQHNSFHLCKHLSSLAAILHSGVHISFINFLKRYSLIFIINLGILYAYYQLLGCVKNEFTRFLQQKTVFFF